MLATSQPLLEAHDVATVYILALPWYARSKWKELQDYQPQWYLLASVSLFTQSNRIQGHGHEICFQ
jgi:hypothetical protein